MAITVVESNSDRVALIKNAVFAAEAAPTSVIEGYVNPHSDLTRVYLTFAGAVTSFTLELWYRNPLTRNWHLRGNLFDQTGMAAPSVSTTTPPVRDVIIPRGQEFYIRVSAIAPGTSGNTLTVHLSNVETDIFVPYNPVIDTEFASATAAGDTVANPTSPAVLAMMHDFNGSTWERMRQNENKSILTSAARTSSPSATDQTMFGGIAVIVYVNITVLTATGTLQTVIEGKDPVSGVYFTLLQSAAETTTGLKIYRVDPRLTDSAGLIAATTMPRIFRIRNVHGNAVSITYSVSVDTVG